jgi:signal transduction histidine kinase
MVTLLRSENFRQTLKRKRVDLAGLIHGVAEQVRPFVQARSQRLEISTSEALDDFEIDPDKMHAALVNLLTNAIKFTPDGGLIRISAWAVGDDCAEIEVEDHGVGLEPQALRHLFKPFFTQIDPSRHSSGEFGFEKRGLGLGLCIAKQFVEMHGGRIWAQSIEEGGTRVTISLPRRGELNDPGEPVSVVNGERADFQKAEMGWEV